MTEKSDFVAETREYIKVYFSMTNSILLEKAMEKVVKEMGRLKCV